MSLELLWFSLWYKCSCFELAGTEIDDYSEKNSNEIKWLAWLIPMKKPALSHKKHQVAIFTMDKVAHYVLLRSWENVKLEKQCHHV